MDKFMLDSGISNIRKHCSANILAVVTTIVAALSMQTPTEQRSAKPADLVFAEGQGSGPPYRLWKCESNWRVNSAGQLVLLKCFG